MKISSLNDIVDGSLQNTPAISFVTQIQVDIKKVNEGDAYFVSNNKYTNRDLNKAISKGAFAIIYEGDITIQDEEIAWIKVENISKSIQKLLRYNLKNIQPRYISVDNVFLQFLKLFYTKDQNIIILEDDIIADYSLLSNTQNIEMIFCTNKIFLEAIGTNVEKKIIKSRILNNLISHSLFETTFSYQTRYFEHLKLSNLYVKYLIAYCELFGYDIEYKKLAQLPLLNPIFLNKKFEIVANGQSNRFILASKDKTISKLECNYLQQEYKYAKLKIVNIKTLNHSNLIEDIKQLDFNALYIKGINHNELLTLMTQQLKIYEEKNNSLIVPL